MLSYLIGPLGGEARAGLVADATSVRTAIVSGGVLCVAGVAGTAVALRDFWRYDAATDRHAERERELRSAREATPIAPNGARRGGQRREGLSPGTEPRP